MRPVICMITDGRLGSGRDAQALVDTVGAAARAGVDLIQIRERGLNDRILLDAVGRAVAAVRGTRARVLVNDRLDVAIEARAHGVHLRSDSYSARRARAVIPGRFLIGRSVHSADEAVRASREGAIDYLVFGAVFATSSKPGVTPAGVEALAETARATTIPVLAVGGITADNIALVANAGAAGVAAIGFFADRGTNSLSIAVEHVTRAFDTPGSGS